MTKVTIKSENITFLGGIFRIMGVFSLLGLGNIIDITLGKRGINGKAYKYSDVISTVFYSYLCGSNCLEYINTLLPEFSQRLNTNTPRSDIVGRGLKELSVKPAELRITIKRPAKIHRGAFTHLYASKVKIT